MRQVALLPSGVQIAHQNTVLYFSDDYILFASSLAVYVLNPKTFQVEKILSCTQKAISAISVCPLARNLLAVSSTDGSVTAWQIDDEQIVSKANLNDPVSVAWDPFEKNRCAIVSLVNIRLMFWDLTKASNGLVEVFSVRSENIKPKLVRWSVSVSGLLAIGCTAGTVFLFNAKDRSHKILQSPEKKADVVDVQWDRLSTSYLLVAYTTNLLLWDSVTLEVLMTFDKQPLGLCSTSWMDWTAGNFVTANGRNSHLKIWNASQKSSVRSVKVPYNGAITGLSFNASVQRALLSFQDGTVAVYDIDRNRIDFKSEAGHTETIFSCKYSPLRSDQFATASYDGTVKLWDLNQLKLMKTLYGNGEYIYCLDWSMKARAIAASFFSGLIMLWNPKTGRELIRLNHHTKASYCLEWNPMDEGILLSTSADFGAIVYDINLEALIESEVNNIALGSTASTSQQHVRGRSHDASTKPNTDPYAPIKFKFFHPAPVYGCSWNRFKPAVFCTACHDGLVRVFNINSKTLLARTLMGHAARVFSCLWSPIVPGLLATGSDDYSVMVWDVDLEGFAASPATALSKDQSLMLSVSSLPIENEHQPVAATTIVTGGYSKANGLSAIRVLQGHTSYVRALSWNHENKHLLFSGSWDSTIRIWNVMTGSCLLQIHDHIADVYSLVSHPAKPFTYLSCSRDTTVRLWEVEGIFRVIRYYCLWDEGFHRMIGHEDMNTPYLSSNQIFQLPPRLSTPGGDEKSTGSSTNNNHADEEEGENAYFPGSLLSLDDTLNEFALSSVPTIATTFALLGSRSHTIHEEMEAEKKRFPQFSFSYAEGKMGEGATAGRLLNSDRPRSLEEIIHLAISYYQIFSFFMNCNGSMDLMEVLLQSLQGLWVATNVTEKEIDEKANDSRPRRDLDRKITSLLRSKELRKVFSASEIIQFAYSELNQLQMQREINGGGKNVKSTIISRTKEQENNNEMILQEHYMIFQYVKLQEYEAAIELLKKHQEWELALALAPMISREYWQTLAGQYGESLRKSYLMTTAVERSMMVTTDRNVNVKPKSQLSSLATTDERCVPFLLVSGKYEAAIEYYLSRQDYSSAKILGEMMASSSSPSTTFRGSQISVSTSPETHRFVKEMICKAIVDQYLLQGQPILACAELLSIQEVDVAIELLYRCGEIDLAFCLSQCTPPLSKTSLKEAKEVTASSSSAPILASFLTPPRTNFSSLSFATTASTLHLDPKTRTNYLLLQWANRCASYHAMDVAIHMLQELSFSMDQQEIEIALLLSKHCNETRHRKLLQQYHLRPLVTWQQIAKEQEVMGSTEDTILYYLLSRQYMKAAQVSIVLMKKYIREPWEFFTLPASRNPMLASSISRCYQVLKYLRVKEIHDENLRYTYLCCLLWFTAHESWLLGLFPTSTSMLSLLLSTMQGEKSINVGLSREDVLFQLFVSVLFARQQETCEKLGKELMEEMQRIQNQTIKDHIHRVLQLLMAENGQGWKYWIQYAAMTASTSTMTSLLGVGLGLGGKRLGEAGSEAEQTIQLILKEIPLLSAALSLPSIFHVNQWQSSHLTSSLSSATSHSKHSMTGPSSYYTDYEFLQRILAIPTPVVLGSSLPVANQSLKQYRSYLTLKRIQGSSVPLDSHGAVISLNEALQWSLVNPYSPLLNGDFLFL